MNKRWHPGLVARDEKRLSKYLKFVDIALEVLDARLPATSRNNRLHKLLGRKKRVIILNKSDLADTKLTGLWLNYLASQGWPVLAFNALNGQGIKELERLLLVHSPDNLKYNRSMRLMVVGIPNVGKSTIINRLVSRMAARTGEKPGITRGEQWIRLKGGWEILDTPGLLPPYVKDGFGALALAAIGSISANSYDPETVARWLLELFCAEEEKYQRLLSYYFLKGISKKDPDILIVEIGYSRGLMKKGGEVDSVAVAQVLLKDFRKGALGPITLERPENK